MHGVSECSSMESSAMSAGTQAPTKYISTSTVPTWRGAPSGRNAVPGDSKTLSTKRNELIHDLTFLSRKSRWCWRCGSPCFPIKEGGEPMSKQNSINWLAFNGVSYHMWVWSCCWCRAVMGSLILGGKGEAAVFFALQNILLINVKVQTGFLGGVLRGNCFIDGFSEPSSWVAASSSVVEAKVLKLLLDLAWAIVKSESCLWSSLSLIASKRHVNRCKSDYLASTQSRTTSWTASGLQLCSNYKFSSHLKQILERRAVWKLHRRRTFMMNAFLSRWK